MLIHFKNMKNILANLDLGLFMFLFTKINNFFPYFPR